MPDWWTRMLKRCSRRQKRSEQGQVIGTFMALEFGYSLQRSDLICFIVLRVHCGCCVVSPGIWLPSGQHVGLSETGLLTQVCPAKLSCPLPFQV